MPTLLIDGDDIEKATWADVRALFPHYEEFWEKHLVPLRAEGSIQPRRGIDEEFEFLAMFHYSTYVKVSRAIEKCRDVRSNPRFPDEIYLHLYGAAELGFKVVDTFNRIYQQCLGTKSGVSSTHLRALKDRFGEYRNLVHEQVSGVRLEATNLMIPVPEKIKEYRKWTAVLYEARAEDFVSVEVQVNSDLRALCSTLEDAWKGMCKASEPLAVNTDYLRRRNKGESAALSRNFAVAPVSGAQVSATAVNAVLSSGTHNE